MRADIIHIQTVSEFREALAQLLVEAEHWGLFLGELRAIHAWTANGRTPLLSERVASMLAFRAAREVEAIDEPLELVSHLERMNAVGWFFNCWPTRDSERERGALSTSRTPSLDEIDDVASTLRRALIEAGEYDVPRPPESAFASGEPLFRDTMKIMEWFRWVLLARLDGIVAGTATMPQTSQLCRLCGGISRNPKLWGILYALGQIDDLFLTPVGG